MTHVTSHLMDLEHKSISSPGEHLCDQNVSRIRAKIRAKLIACRLLGLTLGLEQKLGLDLGFRFLLFCMHTLVE